MAGEQKKADPTCFAHVARAAKVARDYFTSTDKTKTSYDRLYPYSQSIAMGLRDKR